ncbi:suppressor of RPS4-RLD 1-like isoform X2 [Camellia sinensis]|uniref:suppressor of RPS4-RLD 1-like isoform X2 n=1 Tax=Camellia sinensis TaxID=4442 RepID=UPI001036B2D8|nr:suppressor of RPS4-RLD 1-like isoform X2 [Camellia sinensis]
MASPAISERVELAKLCSSRDWSKAIRVLDSLLSQSFSIQDICNRAFCYSQLELHKHVIKDCDKALQLDPTLLQAYILKGHAFSALGRKEDALLVWEQGYEYARCQSADLKQLLELEELLTVAKQNRSISCENHDMESSGTASEAGPVISRKSNETCNNHNKLSGASELCSELSDTSEFPSESNDTFGIHNESSDKVKMNRRFDGQPNGSYNGQPNGTYNGQSNGTSFGQPNGTYSSQSNGTNDILNKSGDESELSRELSDTCNKPSVICRELSNVSEICSKLSDQSDVSNESSGEAKKNKKFCVTRISKTKSISVDFRLSRGIAQVNEGKYDRAISIFDQILNEDPTYPEALIGRGTAYAFQRELDAAIADFTRAIQSNPSAVEAWKRRGQARAALGESDQAIADLTKALEFEPNSEDVLHERGIVNFKFKDFHAAIEDLSASIKLDKDNKSAYTYLGLALSSIGEYRRAEEAHKKSIQLDPNFLEAWAHLTQLYHDLANSEQAVECINQVLQIDGRYAKSYYLRGLLLHGMGEHRNAIKDLSVGLSLENSNIECLYLRASCHHAIGEYREAVKDYDAALDLELDSMEKFVLQCLAFYQKEIALYTASKINSEFCWFDIDGDINPLFKEYWCKRLHPKNVCEKVYRQPTLRDSLKKGNKLRKQDFAVTKQKTALTRAADSIGKKIQYSCLGFLPSRRQIMKAESCSDLYRVVGEDFWLATWCDSTVFEGRHLEGTRITLVKMGEHGFDFAIRTPCTPSRWEGFDAEMAGAWEALCNAYCGETYGSSDFSLLENVRDAILRMTYYWYNFMPLSRGSAAVGFVVLLGLLLAANMEFTGSIPEGFQVDWEAILNSDPNSFVDSVKSWLYPSLKVTTSWKDYPDVASTFETTGSVVAALSTYSD